MTSARGLAIKTAIKGFFGGGAIYGFAVLLALAGLAWWAVADHYYDEGVEDCQADQAAADAEVETHVDTALAETGPIDDTHIEEISDATETYQNTLTAQDLRWAYQQGVNAGAARAQSQSVDAARKAGGCLTEPYGDDDGLRNSAQSLQSLIFEGGARRDGAGSSDPVRPATPQDRLSGPPPGQYPSAD